MYVHTGRIAGLLAAAAVLVVTASCAPTNMHGGADGDLLGRAAGVLSEDELSESLWPGWEVSLMPLALYREGGACYLIRHPKPPTTFSRSRDSYPIRDTVYEGATSDAAVDIDDTSIGDVATIMMDADSVADMAAGDILCEAFRVHELGFCAGLPEMPDLVTGYPVIPHQLAMADIECEALALALTAPPESLEVRVLEFVSLRSFRRMDMMRRYVEYERRMEFEHGIPGYIKLACKAIRSARNPGHGHGLSTAEEAAAALSHAADVEWYRGDRFSCTGAALCSLLDRYHPQWKGEVERRCVEPYEILRGITRGHAPGPSGLLERYRYEARKEDHRLRLEAEKSEAERAYDSIVGSEAPTLIVQTKLLSSASLSYDPENILRVDARREVHSRLIRLECSGGTHIRVLGRPTAVDLGEGDLVIEQMTFAAPSDISIVCDGVPLGSDAGVTHAQRSLIVSGEGLSIEAAAAAVIVGEARTTIILHH